MYFSPKKLVSALPSILSPRVARRGYCLAIFIWFGGGSRCFGPNLNPVSVRTLRFSIIKTFLQIILPKLYFNKYLRLNDNTKDLIRVFHDSNSSNK